MTTRALAGSGWSLNQVAENSKGGTECRQSAASGPRLASGSWTESAGWRGPSDTSPLGTASVRQPAATRQEGRWWGMKPRTHAPPSPDFLPGLPNDPAPPDAERAARSSPRPSTQPGLPARGSPAGLTVEVLGRLPPQGLQAHLGVGPLQDQPPAVQVGAVTQGVEGSL